MEKLIKITLEKIKKLKHNMEMSEGNCSTGYNPFVDLLTEIQEIENLLKKQVEFDKNNVISWQNCDDVKIGDEGYFADDLEDLIEAFKNHDSDYFGTVEDIYSEKSDNFSGLSDSIFKKSDNDCYYFRYFYPTNKFCK